MFVLFVTYSCLYFDDLDQGFTSRWDGGHPGFSSHFYEKIGLGWDQDFETHPSKERRRKRKERKEDKERTKVKEKKKKKKGKKKKRKEKE